MTMPIQEFLAQLSAAKWLDSYKWTRLDMAGWMFECFAFSDDGAHYIEPAKRSESNELFI